jgi:hypothetical protein
MPTRLNKRQAKALENDTARQWSSAGLCETEINRPVKLLLRLGLLNGLAEFFDLL